MPLFETRLKSFVISFNFEVFSFSHSDRDPLTHRRADLNIQKDTLVSVMLLLCHIFSSAYLQAWQPGVKENA